jgi:hypothetical protein
VPQFSDHCADGAAAQRFFHRPQQVAHVRDGHCQQAFGRKAKGFQPGPVRRAAFGERHVLGDPNQPPARRHANRKPRRRGDIRLAGRRDLVQRAAR